MEREGERWREEERGRERQREGERVSTMALRSTTISETAVLPTNLILSFPQEEICMRTTEELIPKPV